METPGERERTNPLPPTIEIETTRRELGRFEEHGTWRVIYDDPIVHVRICGIDMPPMSAQGFASWLDDLRSSIQMLDRHFSMS